MNSDKHTQVEATAECGTKVTINVPTDTMAVLRSLKPGEDFCMKMYGIPEAELQAAFTAVQNKDNWKMPINTVVLESKVDVTKKAIAHFTGSEATATLLPGTSHGQKMYLVEAAGYYAAIGS